MTALYNGVTADQTGTPFTPAGNFKIAASDDNGYWQGVQLILRESNDGGATFPNVIHIYKRNESKVVEAATLTQYRLDVQNVNAQNAMSADWEAL